MDTKVTEAYNKISAMIVILNRLKPRVYTGIERELTSVIETLELAKKNLEEV